MNGIPGAHTSLLWLAVLALTGCGSLFGDAGVFRDRAEDYKKAPETPVLSVPQDKNSDKLREIYVIPEVEEKLVPEGEFEVPRPAPLVAGDASELVRIQRLGDDSWALIGLAPGQVWPQVRAFLSAAGVQVASVDARAGMIDTSWLEMENQPLPSRFRFRMEQGVQRGTSELHVLQMTRSADSDAWPAASDDVAQEQEMLRAVAQYLADAADTAPVSMVAEQGLSAGGKITLQEAAEGYTYIRLELPFDRAWASLARGLDKSFFEITDRDRSSGVYYTLFLGPEDQDDEGWFDWLWGDDDHPMADQSFLVQMESLSSNVVAITIAPENSELPLNKRQEQDLLALIKGNIN